MANQVVANLIVNMAADIGSMESQLRKAEKTNARRMKAIDKKVKQTERTFSKLGKAVKGAFAAVGVAAAGRAIRDQIKFADQIGKAADKIGLSTDALQEYRHAAQLAGVETTAVDMGLQRFSRRVAEVAAGTGELKKVAEQYGVQLRDSEGNLRNNTELLAMFADVIKDAESEQERLRIAFKLFDSEGAALVNMLNDGGDALDKMRRQAHELGLVLDESFIRKSEKANDQIGIMERQIKLDFTEAIVENADAWVALAKAIAGVVTVLGMVPAGYAKMGKAVGEFFAKLNEGPMGTHRGALAGQLEDAREELARLEQQASGHKVEGSMPWQLAQDLDLARNRVSALESSLKALDKLNTGSFIGRSASQQAETAGGSTSVGQSVPSMSEIDALIEKQFESAQANERSKISMEQWASELEEARSIVEATLTPLEQYQRGLEKLNFLREKFPDTITPEVYDRELSRLERQFDQTADNMSQFAEQAARNMQSHFADFLFDPFSDGLDGMLKGFIQVIQRMIAEAAAARILGGSGGFFGAILGSLGLGGGDGRAIGGPVHPGKAYTVGENGPEMFIPNTAGNISPSGGGVVMHNTFNVPEGFTREEALLLMRRFSDNTIGQIREMKARGRL